MASPWSPEESLVYQTADAMHAQIQRTQTKLSKTRSELNEAVYNRSSTPTSAMRTIQDKDHEIQQLKSRIAYLETQLHHQQQALVPVEQELNRYREQVHQQDLKIRQQEMTIWTQSRTIANPRPDKSECTPFRSISDLNCSSSAPQIGPPPRFDLSNPQQPPTEPRRMRNMFGTIPDASAPHMMNPGGHLNDPFQDNIGQPAPLRGMGRFHNTNALGSPIPLRGVSDLSLQDVQRDEAGIIRTVNPAAIMAPPRNAFSGVQGAASTPAFGRVWTVQSTPMPTPAPAPTQQLVPYRPQSTTTPGPSTPRLDPVIGLFNKVFDMALRYAHTHVNQPSNFSDNLMPESIKTLIMNTASSKSSAFPLMASQNTRYFLVAKLIIDWIMRYILFDETFAGLDFIMDQSIIASRAKIYNTTPATVRHLFLNAVALDFSKLTRHRDWNNFVGSLCNKRAHDLFSIVEPMMHAPTPRRWEDMFDLIVQAHHLAENMHTNIEEFRFIYPRTHESFDPLTMLNLDPGVVGMNQQQTSGRGRYVKIGIHPKVIARHTSVDGMVTSKMLVKASVVLK